MEVSTRFNLSGRAKCGTYGRMTIQQCLSTNVKAAPMKTPHDILLSFYPSPIIRPHCFRVSNDSAEKSGVPQSCFTDLGPRRTNITDAYRWPVNVSIEITIPYLVKSTPSFWYTEALAGGRAPELGWEEIVKKRSRRSTPMLKASLWLKDGNRRVCSSVAIRSTRRRKASLSVPPDIVQ